MSSCLMLDSVVLEQLCLNVKYKELNKYIKLLSYENREKIKGGFTE